jgi:ABC-type multidrug transport system fused ATPase/permease subunit
VNVQNKSDILYAIRIYSTYVKENWDLFPIYLAAAFVYEILTITSRYLFSIILGLLGTSTVLQPYLMWFGILGMDLIQLAVDVLFYRTVVTNFEYILSERLNMKTSRHVSKLGAGFYSSVPASIVKDRIHHIDDITDLMQQSSWSVITHTLQVIVSLVWLFVTLPNLWGVIFTVFILYSLALFMRISYVVIGQQAPFRKLRREQQEVIAEVRDQIIDTNSTIVLNSSMDYFLSKLQNAYSEWRRIGILEMEVGFKNLGIQRNLVLIYGRRGSLMFILLMATKGLVAVPQLVLVNTIIETLFIGMWEIARFMYMFVHQSQSIIKLEEVMDMQPEIVAPINPIACPAGPLSICLEDLGFTYSKVELGLTPAELQLMQEVDTNGHLEGINLSIRAGQRVALIGPSGAGKTTLTSILLGERRPTTGSMRVNGVDIFEVDPTEYFKRVAKVPQGTAIDLYNNTLRFNLTMGRDIPEEKIIAALRAASLWETVLTWKVGLDEKIGERGRTLSGGEQQRVAIARAILQEADLLVLDEATSSLDPQTELAVQHAIDSLPQNLTVITIAHRLATVRNVDSLVLMHEGKIEAQGSWAELSATSERFQRMVNLQNLD